MAEIGVGEAVATTVGDGVWGVTRGEMVGLGVILVEGVTGGGDIIDGGVGIGALVFL
jgi:hypothetical protein